MDKILTEKELVQRENLPWGCWMFSLPNDKLQNKLVHVKKTQAHALKWNGLYSFLQNNTAGEMKFSFNLQNRKLDTTTCESMECSAISDLVEHQPIEVVDYESLLNDLVTNIVYVCNKEGPKLKKFIIPDEDINLVKVELSNLGEDRVRDVMLKTWDHLLSDYTKLRFCVLFRSDEHLIKILCKDILLPWLSKHMPRNVEQLSEILSVQGKTICRLLIAPLLRVEDSPITEDLMNLEELMINMTKNDWSMVLMELVSGLGELEKWQIPIFTVIVEHAQPSCNYLGSLIQLMSSNGSQFCQNRDFGSLLVAVAKKVPPESNSLISQLKTICNSYKGSLKYKVLKILND